MLRIPEVDVTLKTSSASWPEQKVHRQAPLSSLDADQNGFLRGAINLVDAGRVVGWAQDIDFPDIPVRLKILVDGVVVVCTVANLYREELRRNGLGNGRHGFDAVLPKRIGGTGLLEVRRETDGMFLDSWPSGQLGRRLVSLEPSLLMLERLVSGKMY